MLTPSATAPPAVDTARPTIAWLVNAAEFDSASVRYRCAHPLANLALRGLCSKVYTKPELLARELASLDIVIIVKRLDPGIISLVVGAAEASKQVYLDLCDDLISEDGRSSLLQLPQATLRAVAPLLTAILCPTATMQSRVHHYLQKWGLANVWVNVIPDCIETDDTYHVSGAVWAKTPGTAGQQTGAVAAAVEHLPPLQPASLRLCWFGNWGGPHSDFGITSLFPVLDRLNGYAHRHELALHIVSNHEELGDLVKAKAQFPVVYHPWSRRLLGALLAKTQFTLVTSGEDQFSVIKSPNRALLSLAAGVPVIVEGGAESVGALWAQRDDIPLTERITDILFEAREQGYAPLKYRLLAAVKPALDDFRLDRVGSAYIDLFERHRPVARPRWPSRLTRIAHVFGPDEDLDLSLQIRDHCNEAGIEFLAITSLSTLNLRQRLFGFLAENGIKPSVFVESEAAPADTRRLRGAQLVVQSSSSDQAMGAQVRQWCDARGVALMSQGEFLYRFGRH